MLLTDLGSERGKEQDRNTILLLKDFCPQKISVSVFLSSTILFILFLYSLCVTLVEENFVLTGLVSNAKRETEK